MRKEIDTFEDYMKEQARKKEMKKTLVLTAASLLLIAVLFGTQLLSRSSASALQIGTAVLIVLYCGLNIILRLLSNKSFKPISEPFKKVVAILLALTAFYAFYMRSETRNGSTIVCLIILLALCLLSYKFTILNKDRWNVPDEPLKKLVELKYIGISIAVLQVFIAIPSMEDAVDNIRIKKDREKMEDVLAKGKESLKNIEIVDIPDSLQDDFIKDIRLAQSHILTYAKLYDNFEPNNFILNEEEKELKVDSILDIVLGRKEQFFSFLMMSFKPVYEVEGIMKDYKNKFFYYEGYYSAFVNVRSQYKLTESSHALEKKFGDISIESEKFEKLGRNKRTNELKKKRDVKRFAKLMDDFYVSENIRIMIGSAYEIAAGSLEYLNFIQMIYAYNTTVDYFYTDSNISNINKY